MKKIEEVKRIATQVRRDILRMTNSAKSGHPGGSIGCADFLAVLYFKILRTKMNNFDIKGENEDVFLTSNGHISPALYSILSRFGYFPTSELATFRKLNTRLQGHPSIARGLPGIRIASGSLGQGLSVGIGIALGKKLNHDDKLVFVLMGDGELQEGQNWEAMMFASHHKVDNLIATVDYNQKQIDGPLSQVMSLGNLNDKFSSFGWEVLEMNGNDIENTFNTINKAISFTGNGKPVSIIMNTKMSYGIDFMEDDHKWHGVPPDDEQLERALLQLEETLGDY